MTTSIPSILTANTYYWRPSLTASGRRNNERRHNDTVSAWLTANADALASAGIVVKFDYSESSGHVYKHIAVFRHGKRSNITAVRKALGC